MGGLSPPRPHAYVAYFTVSLCVSVILCEKMDILDNTILTTLRADTSTLQCLLLLLWFFVFVFILLFGGISLLLLICLVAFLTTSVGFVFPVVCVHRIICSFVNFFSLYFFKPL